MKNFEKFIHPVFHFVLTLSFVFLFSFILRLQVNYVETIIVWLFWYLVWNKPWRKQSDETD